MYSKSMTNTKATASQTTTVAAEDAPIGVQLWPTTAPQYARNFTLATVDVITHKFRDESGTYEWSTVEWTYENGSVRNFDLGEHVAVQYC